jgi:hypothetical protein
MSLADHGHGINPLDTITITGTRDQARIAHRHVAFSLDAVRAFAVRLEHEILLEVGQRRLTLVQRGTYDAAVVVGVGPRRRRSARRSRRRDRAVVRAARSARRRSARGG